ncbi:uncharacterized protein LOC125656936 [Ostrea edulis]|uniref:uncharacterized protein LOC125656936 n=1 Tax=Ostrea edulis TaxID=37623 RepID=UPI0024AEEA7E|nr:uncharacterized protein LOC125656936 [Ostrea edulis]
MMLGFIILLFCSALVIPQNNAMKGLGGVHPPYYSRSLNPSFRSMLSWPSIPSQANLQSTFLEIMERVATLLKQLLPFANILLNQISRILQSAISGLREITGKVVSLLNVMLPDWRNVLRELLEILQKLITEYLPELPPLVKEVLNLVEMLLNSLLGIKLCDVSQISERNPPKLRY